MSEGLETVVLVSLTGDSEMKGRWLDFTSGDDVFIMHLDNFVHYSI